MKLSKDVLSMRDQESFLLQGYQSYLKILEQLQKIKPAQMIHKTKIDDVE